MTCVVLHFAGILGVGQKLFTAFAETCIHPKNAAILVLARSQGFNLKQVLESPLSHSCEESSVTQREATSASEKLMSWERDQAQCFWGLPSWSFCKILWILDLKQADVFQRQFALKNKQNQCKSNTLGNFGSSCFPRSIIPNPLSLHANVQDTGSLTKNYALVTRTKEGLSLWPCLLRPYSGLSQPENGEFRSIKIVTGLSGDPIPSSVV